MSTVILYGSRYGTSRRYAQALAERTGLPCYPADQAARAEGCAELVYVGGLYAGGVCGLGRALRALAPDPARRYLIATVGLADPHDAENIRNIRTALQARLPKPVLDNARLFHLRGGIDYSRLNFAHRTMMRLLYAAAKNQPPEQQNAETRAMIETYGKAVDFVDLAALGPIVQALAGQGDGEKPQV